MQRTSRIKIEMERFKKNPPSGIYCDFVDDSKIDQLEASILGPSDSPYSEGVFNIKIQIPERYPFEPPSMRFVTKIYHPNIDTQGRICLNALKMPPNGAWKPSLNIAQLLVALQNLLLEPNPDDPLMEEIAEIFKHNSKFFKQTAKKWTIQYATSKQNHAQNIT